MINWLKDYALQTPSTGHTASQTLDAAVITADLAKYVIEMPVRDAASGGKPVSSLLIGHRATAGSYVAHAHVFGAVDNPAAEGQWHGPIATVALSSTELAGVAGTANCRFVKDIGGTDWQCGPAKQVDTQDFGQVAILLTIASTANGFEAGSGIQLDIFKQDASA